MGDLVLDACVLINLAATGVPFVQFANACSPNLWMAKLASQEVLYIADANGELEIIEITALQPMVVIDLSGNEDDRFVELAAELGDGEAASIALAENRGWRLATDDRKAIRIARIRMPTRSLETTCSLIRHWSEKYAIEKVQLSEVLQRIETRASFLPPRDDANRDWWITNRL